MTRSASKIAAGSQIQTVTCWTGLPPALFGVVKIVFPYNGMTIVLLCLSQAKTLLCLWLPHHQHNGSENPIPLVDSRGSYFPQGRKSHAQITLSGSNLHMR